MKKSGSTPWLMRILALFFAVLFFYNANLNRFNSNDSNVTKLSATAEKVPVNVIYDQDKYFISGFDQSVTVELTSSNKILLDKESNSETRSFSVRMDLSKYSVGTHEVPLEIVGLASAIEGKIVPSKLSVTIENRTSNKFQLETSVSSSIFAEGFEQEKVTVEPEIVTLSGGEETLSKVARVIASVTDKSNVSADFSQKVMPYAIDEEGNILDVAIEPAMVRVNVEVKLPSKKVTVKPVQSGTIPQGIEDYTFSMKDNEVTLTGPKESLDAINELELKIDTSSIKETVGNSYALVVPKDVTVDPVNVFVTVIPKKATDSTSSTKSNVSTSLRISDKISKENTKSKSK